MNDLNFEERFLSATSFVPDLIAELFNGSAWRKDDLALSISGTEIISLRVIQEFNEVIEQVLHVVQPIDTRGRDGQIEETGVTSYMEWVTLETERGDVSFRISIVFQDAISLRVDRKNPYLCMDCSDQLEECPNVFDEEAERYESEQNPELYEPWWDQSRNISQGPRIFDIDVSDKAVGDFAFHVAHALANSIAWSSFDSMTEESELLPLSIIRYLWHEISERVAIK